MIKLIFGIILSLIPFLLVNAFDNKKKGFFYILSGIIFFNLILALLTQSFHVFNYNAIIFFSVLADVCILYLVHSKDKDFKKTFASLKSIKIDWMLIFILVVLFIELYAVHYNYTGKVSTLSSNGAYESVKNAKIIYPYYSDEWSAVALVKFSIQNKSLPFTNPFTGKFFNNFEFCFHSFIAQVVLLFGLDPLAHYSYLALFFGILICVLVYFLLRNNGIEKINAGICALLVPLILCGANLPGLWYLLPLTLGIVCLLLGYIFISLNEKKMGIFMSFLVLLFYPPLFIFYTISLILYFVLLDIPKKDKIRYLGIYFLICIITAFLVSVKVLFFKGSLGTTDSIFSKLFYSTFTKNAIPDYSIWKVIPIPVLLLSALGIFKYFWKKLWLVGSVFIGLVFWIMYSFVLFRFIIEYQRVVIMTSILIVVFSGFGLQYLIKYIEAKGYVKKNIIVILQVLILGFLLIFAFYYTQRNDWQGLKLHDLETNKLITPNAPATKYLYADDLVLFKDIKNKRFTSLPWKGLVIGAATSNYPLETKDSTISINVLSFSDFMKANCTGKNSLAKKYKMDYAYSPQFNCSGFKQVGKSSENFYLYGFD